MLKILICEDNEEYRRFIVSIINSCIAAENLDAEIVFEGSSPMEAQKFIIEKKPNAFFLDIELNADISGYDLAVFINDILEHSYIVFISQYADFVFKSFKVRAFDFLPKPVSKEELESVLKNMYADYLRNAKEAGVELFHIKTGAKIYRIPKEEIIMIEKLGNRCIFYSVNATVYSYETLESILHRMKDDRFIRCHRGYIVNKLHIITADMAKMEISASNGHRCDIGGKYKEDLIRLLSIPFETAPPAAAHPKGTSNGGDHDKI